MNDPESTTAQYLARPHRRVTATRWYRCGLAASCLLHLIVVSWPISLQAPRALEPLEVVFVDSGSTPPPSAAARPSASVSPPAPRPRLKSPSRIRQPKSSAAPAPQVRKPEDEASPPPAPGRPMAPSPSIADSAEPRDALPEPPAAPDSPVLAESGATRQAGSGPSASPHTTAVNDVASISPAIATAPVGAAFTPPEFPEPHNGATPAPAAAGGAVIPETKVGAATGPRFVARATPMYPRLARRLGLGATVVLRLAIDDRGRLEHIEVVQPADYGFTDAAVDAARRSVFAPAERDGQPIACRALLPVRFVLRRNE